VDRGGLIAFYNEKVDIFLDGQLLERPKTHFFPSTDWTESCPGLAVLSVPSCTGSEPGHGDADLEADAAAQEHAATAAEGW